MKKTSYLVSFIPRCSDAEHIMEDLSHVVIKATDKQDVICQFLNIEEYSIYSFCVSLLLSLNAGKQMPIKHKKEIRQMIKPMMKILVQKDLTSRDPDDEEYIQFIKDHYEEFVFLIMVSEEAQSDYIRINEIKKNKTF